MNLAEATRQYQATLEYARTMWERGDISAAEDADQQAEEARKHMEVAWLESKLL